MKFNEMINKIENNEKFVICSISSGRRVAYDNIEFSHFTNGGKIVLKDNTGRKIQFRELAGVAAPCGKFNDWSVFVQGEEVIENKNYFYCPGILVW